MALCVRGTGSIYRVKVPNKGRRVQELENPKAQLVIHKGPEVRLSDPREASFPDR